MLNNLEKILSESELDTLFKLNRKDDNTDRRNPFVAYRVKSNIYRIRSFELWKVQDSYFFRIYHSDKISTELKDSLMSIRGVINEKSYYIDYMVDNYLELAMIIKNILLSEDIINKCNKRVTLSKISKFEGLDLPDIDTSDGDLSNVMGKTFYWREIISIWEDNSQENNLKKTLSKKGIYIQRSKDGKSRYIGSASGENGIIGRWMKHLDSNGDARHLNLFILEKGYNEVLFSVIEFYDEEDILKRENMWKQILGTINLGSYNGIQLNNN